MDEQITDGLVVQVATAMIGERDAEIERLKAENEELLRALEIDEQLLDTRNRVLDAIPPCPEHGPQCIPHCVEWIERVQAGNERMRIAIKNAIRFVWAVYSQSGKLPNDPAKQVWLDLKHALEKGE